jgi:hypothetical protein
MCGVCRIMNDKIKRAFLEQLEKSPKLTEEMIDEIATAQRLEAKVGDKILFYMRREETGDMTMTAILDRKLENLNDYDVERVQGVIPIIKTY